MSEIMKYGQTIALTEWRDPEAHLAEAQQAAAALGRVIAMKPKPVIFNGEQYLELEDWQTVGKFYGYTAKVESTNHVEYGGVTGWEATAVVIDKHGTEVGRAESMCMTDEKNWGAVPVYEWQDVLDKNGKKIWDESKKRYKSNKVQAGTEPKPTFQLRSMAQTRACAKAFRQVLSWVVVLGGFKPNVAEELIDSQMEEKKEQPPQTGPAPQIGRKSEKSSNEVVPEGGQQQQQGQPDGDPDPKLLAWKENNEHDEKIHISYPQSKLLFVVMKKTNVNEEAMKAILKASYNVEHFNNILKKDFNGILDGLDPDMEFHKPLAK